MNSGIFSLLIPAALLPLLLAGCGIALIVGARKLAGALFMLVVLSVVLPPLLLPLIEALPIWVLWLGLAYLVFLIPFWMVALFGALVSPALGKGATQQMTGQLARDLTVVAVTAPFKAIAFLFRLFRRNT